MKVFLREEIQMDDRVFSPGIHEVNVDVARSLYVRGPARPATNAEIAESESNSVETASAHPARETASATPLKQTKKTRASDVA